METIVINLNMKTTFLITSVLVLCSVVCAQQKPSVTKEILGDNNGSEVSLFTLINKDSNVVKLTNYGAKIVRIVVPDKNGLKDNVTNNAEKLDMIVKGDPFGGASIGRFANRIANAKFTLDGVEYSLPVNNAPNTLHGGRNGWFSKVWTAEIINAKEPSVKFSYTSPDMEEGFPGTVSISVTYTWSDKNEIIIDYAATTDKKTVINVTNHAYFNLHGTGKGYIFDHVLTLKASKYTPLNTTKIPTGEIKEVKGTPYDFTSPHPIGYRIGDSIQGTVFQGYDDNFVLDKKEKVCATVYDPVSGRVMEVTTDQPGLQFYSGMGGMAWKKSVETGVIPAITRSAFALETQHFPDSPNQPSFPSTVLNPGDKFKSKTIYRFSVKK
jgi:aldose 1-epimerase